MHSAAKSSAAGDWPAQSLVCVVGAPRCGTTTLARWLRDHPSVQLSSVKEPHYFSQFDLNDLDEDELRKTVRHEFLDRYFTEIDPAAEMLADGSVSYLYTPERLLPLLRLWPDAKFVIGVRDPIELLPSLHQRLSYQGDETARDLETAWRLIEDRRAGRKIPRSCVESRQLIYDEVASLGKHVGHFFDVVGRDRCHVVVFDDLKADPAKAYEGMLDFLGLPHAPLNRTRAYRARHGYRFGWLQRLLKRPPVARTVLAGEKFRKRVASAPHKEPSFLSRKIMATRKALLKWNRAPAPKVHLRPAFVEEIRETLQDDVAKLGRLIGRDLGHWLGRKDAGASMDRAA